MLRGQQKRAGIRMNVLQRDLNTTHESSWFSVKVDFITVESAVGTNWKIEGLECND